MKCYWNSTRGVWSVLPEGKGQKVVHLPALTMRGVSFVVWEGGYRRFQQEKRKNVHAFAKGELEYEFAQEPEPGEGWDEVRYSPWRGHRFHRESDGLEVAGCEVLRLLEDGRCFAKFTYI